MKQSEIMLSDVTKDHLQALERLLQKESDSWNPYATEEEITAVCELFRGTALRNDVLILSPQQIHQCM